MTSPSSVGPTKVVHLPNDYDESMRKRWQQQGYATLSAEGFYVDHPQCAPCTICSDNSLECKPPMRVEEEREHGE